MGYAEEVVKLRKRMADAIRMGVVDKEGADIYQATLVQIMNEAERYRQQCYKQAEQLRHQAAEVEGKGSAFVLMGSIIFGVLNAFVEQAEKAAKEEASFTEEQEDKTAMKKKKLKRSEETSEEDDK